MSIAAGVFAVGAMFGMAGLIKTGMDTSRPELEMYPDEIELSYRWDYTDV